MKMTLMCLVVTVPRETAIVSATVRFATERASRTWSVFAGSGAGAGDVRLKFQHHQQRNVGPSRSENARDSSRRRRADVIREMCRRRALDMQNLIKQRHQNMQINSNVHPNLAAVGLMLSDGGTNARDGHCTPKYSSSDCCG